MKSKYLIALCVSALVAGCATMVSGPNAPTDAEIVAALKASFKETGPAKLDRLDQSDLQRACSIAAETGKDLDPKVREALQSKALAAVKYPADGKYLGDWKRGEAIAQSGRGMQFSDAPNTVAGGNCYACHQVDKAEISHGNIGPTLWNYGKLRGNSEAIVKYTWARIWNSHGFNACANMPRFGDAGILTEAQIKDVMALLLDAESPVNK
ncbi:MAG: sulfur oxidation c-type cytochrome SoxX [Burkholderiales bacterium]|nr:MAG: sulfur oxidation c-type cytochrome SoxX [Burkholderiales bacterium]TAG77804.1 MAG: sulfur oxidation c-type cytochrome SoxX [Betaproteobacteria bacterium]